MLFAEAVKGKKAKCDNCNQTFDAEKTVLKPCPENISMEDCRLSFKFVDKNGYIVGGNRGPNGKLGDQIAHCPLCGFSHLFGFEIIN